MDAAFEQLKNAGQNNVDNLVYWMKNSKVVEDSEEAETKVRRMFADASDQNDIQYEKFTQVVDQLAAEQNMTHDQLMKMLADAGPRLQGALSAAANAFRSALGGK